MITLNMKPVSTNKIWTGRKYLSAEAKRFKQECTARLRMHKVTIPDKETPMELHLRFGLSRDMDVSNCIKLLEDCIADAVGINDIQFQGITAVKERVRGGMEFISFDITDFKPDRYLPPR